MRKLVALVGVGALCLSSLAAAGSGQVTLAVQVIELPGYEPTHAFSGRIERPVAGELVTVLGAVCPRTFETSMAGVTTTAGGGWETSTPVPKTSVTYRARWEGRFSEPVRAWTSMPVEAQRAGRTSVVVRVDTSDALQDLNRKLVELQRRDRATFRWRRYRSMRLQRDTSTGSPFTFKATFTGVVRNGAIRVRIPPKTAAPCFRPQMTAPLRP